MTVSCSESYKTSRVGGRSASDTLASPALESTTRHPPTMSLSKTSLPSSACIKRVEDYQTRSMVRLHWPAVHCVDIVNPPLQVAEFARMAAQQAHEEVRLALPAQVGTESFNQTLKMVVKAGLSATLFAAALADDNSGRIYAVKTRPPKDSDLAKDELAVLKAMRNANDGHGLPFCARLLADFETSPGRPALVFEVHRGSLGDLVDCRHRVTIEPTQMYVWAAQLVSSPHRVPWSLFASC